MGNTLKIKKEIEKRLDQYIEKYKGCSKVPSSYRIGNVRIDMIGDFSMEIYNKHLEINIEYESIKEFVLRKDLEYNEHYINVETKDGNYANIILDSILEER